MDNNTPFYNQGNFDSRDSDRRGTSSTQNFAHDYGRNVADDYDIDGQPFDPAESVNTALNASSDYASSVYRGAEHGKSTGTWQSQSEGERNQSGLGGHYQKESPADYSYSGYDGQSSQQSLKSSRQDDRYSSKYNKDYGDDYDRRSRSRGYEYEHAAHDRERQRSTSREHDRAQGDRQSARDWERSRDHEQRTRRHESGYDRDDSDRRVTSRRRSRSRDRDRNSRRHHRDSDRERRHRDSDRDRPRRDDGIDRDRSDRDPNPKEIPWVPPPLPEHLRHLQVQQILNPAAAVHSQVPASPASLVQQYQQQQKQRQPPPPDPSAVQNQFQNDGSFMEMFRQRMQQQQHQGSTAQAWDGSYAVEGPTVAGPAEAVASQEAALAAPAAPSLPATSSGVPVIAKRRISKILKTGVVQKKKKEEEEEESGKDGDGWSSYMKEVQRYRANKCIENEASRPPLVK